MGNKVVWYPTGGQGGPKERRALLVPGRSITIGRDSSGQIVLPDVQVSRAHARIEVEADRVVLSDLQSRNGTRLDGQPISRVVWRPGQTVTLGGYTFELHHSQQVVGGTFRPLSERANVTVGLLASIVFVNVLSLLFNLGHAIYLANSTYAYPTALLLAYDFYPHLAMMRVFMIIIMGLQMLLVIAAMVVFLMWQHRASTNLDALGLTDLSFPGAHGIIWWLMPYAMILLVIALAFMLPEPVMLVIFVVAVVLSLASVLQVLRSLSELWRASIPGMTGAHWRRLPTPAVVIFWWLCWLILPVFIYFIFLLLQIGSGGLLGEGQNYRIMQQNVPFGLAVLLVVLYHLAQLAGGVLMIKSINRITDNQVKAHSGSVPAGTQLL